MSFPILSGSAMPPKSKRARQSLEAAAQGREALKKARLDLEPQSGETVPPPTASTSGEMHAEAAPMSVASSSSATEPMADSKEILQDFVYEWVQSLDRDDKKGLAMLLCLTLVNEQHSLRLKLLSLLPRLSTRPTEPSVNGALTSSATTVRSLRANKDGTNVAEFCG